MSERERRLAYEEAVRNLAVDAREVPGRGEAEEKIARDVVAWRNALKLLFRERDSAMLVQLMRPPQT